MAAVPEQVSVDAAIASVLSEELESFSSLKLKKVSALLPTDFCKSLPYQVAPLVIGSADPLVKVSLR